MTKTRLPIIFFAILATMFLLSRFHDDNPGGRPHKGETTRLVFLTVVSKKATSTYVLQIAGEIETGTVDHGIWKDSRVIKKGDYIILSVTRRIGPTNTGEIGCSIIPRGMSGDARIADTSIIKCQFMVV